MSGPDAARDPIAVEGLDHHWHLMNVSQLDGLRHSAASYLVWVFDRGELGSPQPPVVFRDGTRVVTTSRGVTYGGVIAELDAGCGRGWQRNRIAGGGLSRAWSMLHVLAGPGGVAAVWSEVGEGEVNDTPLALVRTRLFEHLQPLHDHLVVRASGLRSAEGSRPWQAEKNAARRQGVIDAMRAMILDAEPRLAAQWKHSNGEWNAASLAEHLASPRGYGYFAKNVGTLEESTMAKVIRKALQKGDFS